MWSGSPQPVVVAHRGSCGLRPEHSESAFRLALRHGAPWIEVDVVMSRDGVPVIRHEPELSETTDVARRPDLAYAATSRTVSGVLRHGWFAEDLDWAVIRTLRTRERLPALRPGSAAHDGAEPVLRLSDVLGILDSVETAPAPGVVIEIKHSTSLHARGLDVERAVADELRATGWAGRGDRVVVESFERSALVRAARAGVPGALVYLCYARGVPFDDAVRAGASATGYREQLSAERLPALVELGDGMRLAGVSVSRELLVPAAPSGEPLAGLGDRCHDLGLALATWTLRPENHFLPAARRSGPDPAAHGDWAADLDDLLRAGVDAVFVDRPDLVAGRLVGGRA